MAAQKPKSGESLQEKRPDLAAEWVSPVGEKNRNLTAGDVKCGAKTMVNWRCSTCGYEWPATVGNRNRGDGCPECYRLAKMKPAAGESLAEKHPDLAAEWVSAVDEKDRHLTAGDVTCGSYRYVNWRCSTCGHEWPAMVRSRNRGDGCPECYRLARMKPAAGESLKEKRPDLAAEWVSPVDERYRHLTAGNVTCGSNTMVNWRCSTCGHEWPARVKNRTQGKGCQCSSVRGYSTGKPGLLYVSSVDYSEGVAESFLKFGTTNREAKVRVAEEARSSGGSHTILATYSHPDGRFARDLEKAICKEFGVGAKKIKNSAAYKLGKTFDGSSETIGKGQLPRLKRAIEEAISSSKYGRGVKRTEAWV